MNSRLLRWSLESTSTPTWTSKENISMPKSKTHFPQVPVEIARKVAEAESKGHAIEALAPKKKSSNGNSLAELKPDAVEDL